MSETKDQIESRGLSIDRRQLLIGAGAAASLAMVGAPLRSAFAKESITVADPGGPFGPAFDAAFMKPFEQETGDQIVHVARIHYPTTEIKAMVETKSYTWDVVTATAGDQYELNKQGLLEPIDWSGDDMAQIMPEARKPNWMGTDVYASVLCYRSDKYGKNGPQSWADFWNVTKFPGRRAYHKHPIDTLEQALMADGVPKDKVYPIDMDRAFKKLDQIKPHIAVWWTGGAQTSQLLESGECDIVPTWNGRAQVVIDAGKPVEIVWNQGIYAMEGWVIAKGNPKAALGKKFIKFCSNAKRQAEYTKYLAYGPTNPKAYDHIPPERAKFLPTAPNNIKNMMQSSTEWWGTNKEKAIERFNAWLLS
jgi:putative spermidine/putrescine transport system substrate-binding protein